MIHLSDKGVPRTAFMQYWGIRS